MQENIQEKQGDEQGCPQAKVEFDQDNMPVNPRKKLLPSCRPGSNTNNNR